MKISDRHNHSRHDRVRDHDRVYDHAHSNRRAHDRDHGGDDRDRRNHNRGRLHHDGGGDHVRHVRDREQFLLMLLHECQQLPQ